MISLYLCSYLDFQLLEFREFLLVENQPFYIRVRVHRVPMLFEVNVLLVELSLWDCITFHCSCLHLLSLVDSLKRNQAILVFKLFVLNLGQGCDVHIGIAVHHNSSFGRRNIQGYFGHMEFLI